MKRFWLATIQNLISRSLRCERFLGGHWSCPGYDATWTDTSWMIASGLFRSGTISKDEQNRQDCRRVSSFRFWLGRLFGCGDGRTRRWMKRKRRDWMWLLFGRVFTHRFRTACSALRRLLHVHCAVHFCLFKCHFVVLFELFSLDLSWFDASLSFSLFFFLPPPPPISLFLNVKSFLKRRAPLLSCSSSGIVWVDPFCRLFRCECLSLCVCHCNYCA